MKEGLPTHEKKKEKLTTFSPKLDNRMYILVVWFFHFVFCLVEGIELSDTVVVSSFGRPLPKLPAKYVVLLPFLCVFSLLCSCISYFSFLFSSPFHLANFNPHTAASKGSRGKVSKSRHNSSISSNSSKSALI